MAALFFLDITMRKKHNLLKRYRRIADASISKLFVAFVCDGDERCDIIDANGKKVRADQQLADAFDKVPHQWSVCCAVTCKTELGDKYVKLVQIDAKARYYKRDLTARFNEIHMQLLKECNENHRVTAGWIASPKPFEFDEAFVADIMQKLGGWNFKAKLEC